jgi:hypothetical protein
VQDGYRCQAEEGHDTGVGTPHLFAAPMPVSAEDAARELSARMGVPCTAVDVPLSPVPAGELPAGDGSPERAAVRLGALWAQAGQDVGGLAVNVLNGMRARVVGAILDYLRASEVDWAQLAAVPPGWSERTADVRLHAVEDCKQLHDAQVAELLERIGDAL